MSDDPQRAVECVWSPLDDNAADAWQPACQRNAGRLFEFNDGGPTANAFAFCPYCGRPLTEEVPA